MEKSSKDDPRLAEFPQALILRIVKESLPENVSIGKDAKLALTKAAKVFVQYLTAAYATKLHFYWRANDYCQSCNRTLLSSNHVMGALDELELGHYKEKLQKALDEYKATQAKKAKDKKDQEPGKEAEEDVDDDDDIMDDVKE